MHRLQPPDKTMRKTSAYARKQKRTGGVFNGAQWLNTLQRCRAYAPTGDLPGSWIEGTETAAIKAELLVRDAAAHLLAHKKPLDCERTFDILAHAVGVATIRALQIEPDEAKNPAIEPLKDATQALRRAIERYRASGAWGLDAKGHQCMPNAIEIYALILRNSSPEQMSEATEERMKIIAKTQGAQQ
jgi:hypothetical protein